MVHQLEITYKNLLKDVRIDRTLLSNFSYKNTVDKTGNQSARFRLLIALKNFKEQSDYDIASFLFEEELKTAKLFKRLKNYDHRILELSTLILISFHKVEDILRMVATPTRKKKEYVEIDPSLYLLYGKDECLNFLKLSNNPVAAITLLKLEKQTETITEEYVADLKESMDEYYDDLQFPLLDVIEFCISTKDLETLKKEANKWCINVTRWNERLVNKGLKIAEILQDDVFSKKMNIKKEHYTKTVRALDEKRSKEIEEDSNVLKNTNVGGVFIAILFFIGTLGGSLLTAVFSTEKSDVIDRIPYYFMAIICSFMASFAWKGLKDINTNDLVYFEKIYLSGQRTPKLAWTYTDNSWDTYAQEKIHKFTEKLQITLGVSMVIAILLVLLVQELALTTIIFWVAINTIIFYYLNIRKHYKSYKAAYISKTPTHIKIFNQGLSINDKHYIPFNTRYLKLRGFNIIEKNKEHYLSITRNVRSGKYQDQREDHIEIPIPKEFIFEAQQLRFTKLY